MSDIVDSISSINSLCASIGIRSPVGADFATALARALGDVPPTGTLSGPGAAATPTAPGGAVAGSVPSTIATGVPSAPSGTLSMPATGPITSGFGERTSPTSGAAEFHQGLDIGAPYGSPVRAAASGTVSYAGWMQGYGNIVILQHPGGVETRYAHQSQLSVTVGQQVSAGDVLGAVGATGDATGPHLHFEVRLNGQPVDPGPSLGLGPTSSSGH